MKLLGEAPNSTRIIFALLALAWVVIVARSIMNAKGPEDFVVTVTTAQVQVFAKEQLASLQKPSFDGDVELCRIIFEDSDGELGVTPVIEGDQASCDIIYFDEPGMAPVASLHTHGTYSLDYDSEVPSPQDIASDIQGGTDGYVSTPGGRFWRIDGTRGVAELVCGAGCLPQDPAYRACDALEPEPSYTIETLNQRYIDFPAVC